MSATYRTEYPAHVVIALKDGYVLGAAPAESYAHHWLVLTEMRKLFPEADTICRLPMLKVETKRYDPARMLTTIDLLHKFIRQRAAKGDLQAQGLLDYFAGTLAPGYHNDYNDVP